jgi:kynurenine formamidase
MSERPDGTDVLEDYIKRFSNWGRWGEDDEIGTLNLITPDVVRNAASLVADGRVISMTMPYDLNGPQLGGARSNPKVMMIATGSDYLAGAQDQLPGAWGPGRGMGFADDWVITPNQAGTQWDSLAHVFWQGKMYNDRSAGEVTSLGAAHNGIENYNGKVVTRGVLVDVPRYHGVDVLAPGQAVTVNDIEATLDSQGVEIRGGDALVVRTGFLGSRRGSWGDFGAGGDSPGLSLHTLPWIYEREISAVVTDTWGVEVRPNEIDYFQPFHIVGLTHMGLALGEIFDLDALAADCAADGRYEFFFNASPIPVVGAVGAMVSAVAVK